MRRAEATSLIGVVVILAGWWWWREQKKEHERIWANASHCEKYPKGDFFQDIQLKPMTPSMADKVRKNFGEVRQGDSEAQVVQLVGNPTAEDIDSTKDDQFLGCVWEYQVSKDERYEVAFAYPGWTVRDIRSVDNRALEKKEH